ncbi:hypothetical protein [Candidatus Magnetominusculus dajiuhuensis]|uniref:hypothetical protein n=1 Tax=Candidatus Magnetominusculus dajiuhuensis TaxID=3137712 RepID=UPI003B42FA2B
MRKEDTNNGASDEVVNEAASQTRIQGAKIVYKPREMTEYVQFRINAINEKARNLYDVMVTEKSISDFKAEASAITTGFMAKVRGIFDVSDAKQLVDDLKTRPKELKKETLSFYKEMTDSLKKTYYSLVWLYVNYPNSELKLNPNDGFGAANVNSDEGACLREAEQVRETSKMSTVNQ